MTTRWTEKDVKALAAAGKIKGYQQVNKARGGAVSKKLGKHFKKRNKAKDNFARELLLWSQEKSLVLKSEYRFHKERKWKFDFYIELSEKRIGIEWEGIISNKSRHTTVTGYSNDTTKYREASKMGFIVLRYTVLNAQNLITDLNEIYNEVFNKR